METIRESWTDERMDDLSRHVDKGFERCDAAIERCEASIRELRAEMHRGFERSDAAVRDLRGEMHEGFKRTNAAVGELHLRFDAMQRTLILSAMGVIASLIGLIATQI